MLPATAGDQLLLTLFFVGVLLVVLLAEEGSGVAGVTSLLSVLVSRLSGGPRLLMLPRSVP